MKMSAQTQRVAVLATVMIAILLVVIAGLTRMLIQSPPAAILSTPSTPLTPTPQPVPTDTPTPSNTPTSSPTPTPLPTLTPTSVPTPTPLPVPSWSAASKLTSLEYINTIVIERERVREGIESVIPGRDRVMMVVVGNIQAGIDLEKLPVRKIQINGKSIKMVIPHAKILAVELLPEESRIYETDHTWLFSNYEGLEVEALAEARTKLQENSSHNQKMLQMAETLARLQLTQLLRNLGYEQVVIEFE